jgi:hypothetical protein
LQVVLLEDVELQAVAAQADIEPDHYQLAAAQALSQ